MSDSGSEESWCVKIVGIESSVTVVHVADSKDKFLRTTVAELKTLIHEKRPEIETESMRLLFAGKQLSDGDLKSYNLQKRSTIQMVIRVHGGSETDPILRIFTERVPPPPRDDEEVKEHANNDFGLEFTEAHDDITGISFPGDPMRVKMSCGHAADPNHLTQWCRSLIDKQQFKFYCPAVLQGTNQQCKKEWEYSEVRLIALLTDAECTYFESKMSEYAAVQYCDVKECPGCKSYVERGDLTNLRVTCQVCKKIKPNTPDFCWQCLKTWSGPRTSSVKCGRSECAHPELPAVRDSPMFTLNSQQVPIRRACPTCGKVIEHKNDNTCKFMICPRCQKEYCFMCLELKEECLRTAPAGWWKNCAKPIAAKQTSIPVWSSHPRSR